MGKTCDNNMASFSSACVLSILVLVAILHASSAYPTSVDDDNMVYAEWLKQENSKQGDSRSMSRSNEANQGSQFSIRASRRSGAGSGSGTPPPPPPTPTPTQAPTTPAPTGTVASTVVATTTTVATATQVLAVEIAGGAAAFIGKTKEAVTCTLGIGAGTLTQGTDGVCAHNNGMNTAAAATARRAAVTITVTYSVDSAVATVTLTSI